MNLNGFPIERKKLAIEYFYNRIHKDADTGCWLWTGTLLPSGYGQFRFDKQSARAHRASYELLVGEIPDGLCMCHKCDVRRCCNPEHLFIGTRDDNMKDAASKGRLPSSTNHWTRLYPERMSLSQLTSGAKLSTDQVQQIKGLVCKRGDACLVAAQFGVSEAAVSRIVRGHAWK